MIKPLIAGITALALTFAAVSPAQAQGFSREEVGKLLIGLAAIAALNAALENRKSKDRATPAYDRNNRAPQVQGNRGHGWGQLNRNSNHRVLPRECLQSVETRSGTQRMFGQRCLEQNYRHVNSLPGRCALRVHTRNGARQGYDPLCLREAGYTSDRRR